MRRSIIAIILIYVSIGKTNGNFVTGAFKLLMESSMQKMNEPPDQKSLLDEYDFIVIGAGTAGCVIANRLTENLNWKVLLIEAGGPETLLMDIPQLTPFNQLSDSSNWNYYTEPEERACLSLKNRRCRFPRGKVMGGSSVLNSMIQTRCNKRDYDNWSKLGNDGWSYDEVLPYFLKSEDMSIPEYASSKYHKTGGYLTISENAYKTPLAHAFLKAGQELGYKVHDHDGDQQIGFSYIQTTVRNGTRLSSSKAFLHPIHHRKNLHVSKHSHVTKLIINRDTNRVEGVEFLKHSKKYVIRARKEVILSAGAVNSPQILMLSGIGPKDHLQQLEIPLVKDLKVGYNLQDHQAVGGVVFTVNQSVALKFTGVLRMSNLVDFADFHQGPIAIPNAEAIAFFETRSKDYEEDFPDIELLFVGGSYASNPFNKYVFGLTDELWMKVYAPLLFTDTWTVFPMIMRPKSRGIVKLKSNNPFDKPLIYPNYFTVDDDLDTIIRGVKMALRISDTPAMRKYNSKFHAIPIPGCRKHIFMSDDYWKCQAMHLTNTIYHLSGTCKMGNDSADAVVDSKLKVHGVDGIRVADASIMPVIPTGHINAPTVMIAEKASDMIKRQWLI